MAVERVWIWYLSTVTAAVAAVALVDGAPGGRPWAYVALHGGLLAAVLAGRGWMARLPAVRARALRAGFCLLAIPVVFSAMGWVLPAVHPEAYEWRWIAADQALLGTDPTRAVQPLLAPWLVEVLQLAYSSFYALPVIAVLAAGIGRGAAAFDNALLVVTFGFLLSYLGYFLWPTLPPYRFLPHDTALRGVWLADTLYAALDAAEVHRWNCFPSGHTMLSVISLVLVRRQRAVFWGMAPVVVLLIASTVMLRYHYVVDVLAGVAAVPLALWLVRWLR